MARKQELERHPRGGGGLGRAQLARLAPSKLARAAREVAGSSQEDFARLLDVSVTTVRRWEMTKHARYAPKRSALSLLKLVAADPDLAQRVLGSGTRRST